MSLFLTRLKQRRSAKVWMAGIGTGLAVITLVGSTLTASAAPKNGDFSLMMSSASNRSNAQLITTNSPVSGKVAIFVQTKQRIRTVAFYLDDTSRKHAPRSLETQAPFDFATTASDGAATLFDTASLKPGVHYISAVVTPISGGSTHLASSIRVGAPLPSTTTTMATTTTSTTATTLAPATTTTQPPAVTTTTTAKPITTTSTVRPTTTTVLQSASYPNESNTGVPKGTSLTQSGPINIKNAGAVIDALNITGTVTISAPNVTIRRTLINQTGTYAIKINSGASVVVEDSEISGVGSSGSAAICCSNFTLKRVNIHGVFEGPRVNGNVTIEDSYIHHLRRCDGCHIDVLQTTGGSNITIRHNNLQAYNPDLNDPFNAAMQLGETQGLVRNCLVENNLMNGGNYSVNAGGGGTSGAQCTFKDNKFGRDFRYGPRGNLGPGIVWESSNVWLDNGQPVA